MPNRHGENLVGILHETGSKELVVLCHGFQSSKVGHVDFCCNPSLTKMTTGSENLHFLASFYEIC